MYEVRNLRVSLPDRSRRTLLGGIPRTEILRGIDLSVAEDETLGIVGESGSGKSTLARTMLRIYRPSGGTLQFDGRDITNLGERELRDLRTEIQIVFQDSQSTLNPRLRIGTSLMEPLFAYRRASTRAVAFGMAVRLLERVGLSRDFMDRYPHQLSGGQRQRIGIGRALALEPRLLVADEIVSGLDVSVQAQILALLQEIQATRMMAIVLISHDLSVVRAVCGRVAVMRAGKLVETAPTAELFAHPREAYTRRLLAAIPLPEVDPTWLSQTPGDVFEET